MATVGLYAPRITEVGRQWVAVTNVAHDVAHDGGGGVDGPVGFVAAAGLLCVAGHRK